MDQQQRGRSPSVGRTNNDAISRSHSPSAQSGFNQQANARGLDPLLLSQGGLSNGSNTPNNLNRPPSYTEAEFLRPNPAQNFQQQANISQDGFMQTSGGNPSGDYSNNFEQNQPDLTGAFPNPNFSGNNEQMNNVNPDFLQNSNFPSGTDFNNLNFDPTTAQSHQYQYNASAGAQDFSGFGGQEQGALAPTGLPDSTPYPQDFEHQPHPIQPGQNNSGQRSRNHSLSPASAVNPTGHLSGEWAGMSFRGHRRHASDAYSDVSSNAGVSPYFDAPEHLDTMNGHSPMLNSHSPMLGGQTDPSLMNETLGLGGFTLGDQQLPSHISPGHSGHPSPHMGAHNPATSLDGVENFGLMSNNQFANDPAPSMFQRMSQGQDSFPSITFNNADNMGDTGAAAQMETPEISIQLAPDRNQINDAGRHRSDTDALSPPARSRSRQRGRAISDPYSTAISLSRPASPAHHQRSPSVGLHPVHSHSRSSSAGPSNGVTKPRDRASSTSSVPAKREFSLSNLDQQATITSLPSSTPGEGPKRTQKHPATFQCSLCPKRFTRAYNLRSHLRTHTDERPFVCTVCGKAFARQHDRKRHEGLHSGEKKFVCKGLLTNGVPGANTWGCSRRFARADALGRHFRSEAGRACIKPLLDEEARERRAAMMDQANQDMLNQQHQSITMAQQQQQTHVGMPGGDGMGASGADSVDMSSMGMTLPAALLAQYPALAGIQWDTLPAGQPGEMDDEDYGIEGERSSFEASSGGELEYGEEDGSNVDFGASDASGSGGAGGGDSSGQSNWMDMSNLGLQQGSQQGQGLQQGSQPMAGWGTGNGFDGR